VRFILDFNRLNFPAQFLSSKREAKQKHPMNTHWDYNPLQSHNKVVGNQSCSMQLSFFEVGTALLDDTYSNINDQIVELVGDSFNRNVLLVKRLEMKEKYRGKGYGKYVLNSLDIYFKSTCAYVALKSFPIGFEGITDDRHYDKAQDKLNAFYTRCGYTKIRQATDNDPEMDEFDEDIEFLQDDEINHIFIKNIAPV